VSGPDASSTPEPTAPGDLGFSGREKAKVALLYAGILVATVLSFYGAFRFLPTHYQGQVGAGAFIFTGLAITAYVLGLRHGFDVDHIAAIDNTTRKLLNDGQRPLTVGTWFSLGHSTIVCGMIVALVAVFGFISRSWSTFQTVGSVLGTAISGAFLFIIGLINVVIVVEVYRIFRGLRDGRLDHAALEKQMDQRGFMYRYFGRLFRLITEPWHIYPVGVLFGLGFDTTTEVLLIGIAITAAGSGVPLWAVLFLPALFTCGMVLSDTTDGISMRYAYGWAFSHPIRKVFYNLTLTVISVLVAFVIGGVELLEVLSSELRWRGPFWSALQNLNFEVLGFAVAGLFLGCWAVALVVYRWKGYERAGFTPPPTAPAPGGSGPSTEP
jgi:nickel/cobalt transporter (NiCoT) family protein